jgi:hypothetical protein
MQEAPACLFGLRGGVLVAIRFGSILLRFFLVAVLGLSETDHCRYQSGIHFAYL